MSTLEAPSPAERGRVGDGALLEGPVSQPPPGSRGEGSGALAVVDGLACATIAFGGAALAYALDPVPWLAGSVGHDVPAFVVAFLRALLGEHGGAAAIALPFALLGPLGVGIYRGRVDRLVSGLAAAGAASGAVVGLLAFEEARAPSSFLLRAGLPVVLGVLLSRLGTRFHRPDEPWREEARRGPVDATPALAVKIAQARLPLIIRVLLAPVGLALLPVALAGIVFIRCYQLGLSRFLPPQCRFEPSCSRYGLEAFFRLGAVKGFLLTAFRVARCQPFCRAGHDPVPGAHG